MSALTEYPIEPFNVSLRIVFCGDQEELLDEYHLDHDIQDSGSRTFRQCLIEEDGTEFWAITCVFDPDTQMTVGRIAKEAYWATEILFRHLGEESPSHSVKYAMISWIADLIDKNWMQYDLNN